MNKWFYFLIIAMLTACTSSYLKYEGEELTKVQKEFSNQVKIESAEAPKVSPVLPSDVQVIVESKKTTTLKSKKIKKQLPAKPLPVVKRKEPDIEDDAGFLGRRPAVDPYRVGEEIVHELRYFKVTAGELRLKVEPFVKVNDRLSYKFVTEVVSNQMFSTFYSADDRAETLVDYETLIPSVFELHVKETGQLREGRSFFDNQKNKAIYVEKKVTKTKNLEERKQEWEILPYSQNVFSAAFYMRAFKWEEGKEISFRVADDQENLTFKGKVIRKEVLDTQLGPMKAIVIKPEFLVKGFFKPVGDIYIWLSDDDRKFILRLECKIKVGTVISEIIKLNPGNL